MKFLLDQCTDARLLPYLKQLGHDATQIHRPYPQSIPDPEILSIVQQEQRILVTDDRDFGELIFEAIPKSRCSEVWWFDKLTTNAGRFIMSGPNPFVLSLSKDGD
jgi:predicted nuclease of predicted toxin-antitoxin system